MTVGSLGEIVFEVSDKVIKTFSSVTVSGGSTIQSHNRHLRKPLPEFTGVQLQTRNLKFRSSILLGSSPLNDIQKIEEYTENGTAVQLTIGPKPYGRWLITSYKITERNYDKRMILTDAEFDLKLTEYPR